MSLWLSQIPFYLAHMSHWLACAIVPNARLVVEPSAQILLHASLDPSTPLICLSHPLVGPSASLVSVSPLKCPSSSSALFVAPSTPLVGPIAHTLLHASLVGLSILVLAPNAPLVSLSDLLVYSGTFLVSSRPV